MRGVPSPPPALAVRVPFSSQYGGYSFIGKINRGIVQRTFGLNALVSSYPRLFLSPEKVEDPSSSVNALGYGPQFRYVEYMVVGRSWIGAAVFSALFTFFVKLMFKSSVVRSGASEPWRSWLC